MKKFTGFIAAAAIALTPMSSSALEALTDNALNDVTGQAGVSIAIDDVILYQSIGSVSYIDDDGIDGVLASELATEDDDTAGDGASLVIGARVVKKHINAITNATATASGGEHQIGNYGTTIDNYGTHGLTVARALSIDIGKCVALSAGLQWNATALASYTPDFDGSSTVTGVVIGLPTVEITTEEDSYDVSVTSTDANAYNSTDKFIRISKAQSTTAILNGYIEIAPH